MNNVEKALKESSLIKKRSLQNIYDLISNDTEDSPPDPFHSAKAKAESNAKKAQETLELFDQRLQRGFNVLLEGWKLKQNKNPTKEAES